MGQIKYAGMYVYVNSLFPMEPVIKGAASWLNGLKNLAKIFQFHCS